MKSTIKLQLLMLASALSLIPFFSDARESFTVDPTVFLVEEQGALCQVVKAGAAGEIAGELSVVAEHSGKSLETRVGMAPGDSTFTFLTPP